MMTLEKELRISVVLKECLWWWSKDDFLKNENNIRRTRERHGVTGNWDELQSEIAGEIWIAANKGKIQIEGLSWEKAVRKKQIIHAGK